MLYNMLWTLKIDGETVKENTVSNVTLKMFQSMRLNARSNPDVDFTTSGAFDYTTDEAILCGVCVHYFEESYTLIPAK